MEDYEGGDKSWRSGTETERKLKKWFRELDPDREPAASNRWLWVLENFVQGLGKSLNKASRIHILAGEEFDELCHERQPNVWMVRGMGGEWAMDFLEHNYVGFHHMEGVDMSGCTTKEEVREKYSERNPNEKAGNRVFQIWVFINQINKGDYILTEDAQGRIHYGVVGELEYVEDDRPCSNRRPVFWRRGTVELRKRKLQPHKTVFELSEELKSAVFKKIGRLDLVDGHAHPKIAGASVGDSTDLTLDSLASELLLDLDFLEEIWTLL